jgi:hypothetical protein
LDSPGGTVISVAAPSRPPCDGTETASAFVTLARSVDGRDGVESYGTVTPA